MAKLSGFILYRCRACGFVMSDPGPEPEDLTARLQAAAAFLESERGPKTLADVTNKPGLFILHRCTSDQIGIAEIIGGRVKK